MNDPHEPKLINSICMACGGWIGSRTVPGDGPRVIADSLCGMCEALLSSSSETQRRKIQKWIDAGRGLKRARAQHLA